MIHFIKGQLAAKFDGGVVIEASGIGYEITVPDNSSAYLAKDGDLIMLYTAMIVREDDVSLYGFTDRESLQIFRKLMTVSGVGAKAAIAALSCMPLPDLKKAIVFEDAKALARANGIGKKTAERIILELKDKLGGIGSVPEAAQGAGEIMATDEKAEAVNALIALGYTKGEALSAMVNVADAGLSTEEYIKKALKQLF
ncbi:MAG: Holliday junction branch migration protein RuvA [Clostridiales bacterium]|nr:Holliday junction branch migration protein RuvA [Clostridiales bacterium]